MSAADAWAVADPTICPACGRDACEDHLPVARPSSLAVVPRLGFQAAAAILEEPPPLEIVEGAAWADTLTVLVSESGTGKTFLLLGLAAAIGDGVRWLRRDVLQGSVAYASYEGDALGVRLRALQATSGYTLDHLYIVRAHDPISPKVTREGEERSLGEMRVTDALEALVSQLEVARKPPVRLLVIDTVRASMIGSEDGSDHVSAYLRAVRRIMKAVPGAAVILAHHAGWQDGDIQKKRERGSSSWRGNVDGTLYLEKTDYDAQRGEAQLTVRTLKSRDGEIHPPLHCIRRRVDLNERDRRGQPVTSCVIEPDLRSGEDREAERIAVVEATSRETDLAVLRAMRDYPAATSIARLRTYVSLRTEAVSEAVARILRAQLAIEGKRGQPYMVTTAGHASLNGGHP